MKRTRIASILLSLLWFLWGFGAAAREITITVLHTTDVHGYLLPTRDYDGNDNVGGLLKCATLIRSIRETSPNVLLVDCGDLWIGSPESYFTRGTIVRKAVAKLGYDAWVIGNHDFDWGLPMLQRLLESSPAPPLAANICSRPGMPNPVAAAHPFLVQEVEGIRIALVGLTTPGIPYWVLAEDLYPLMFDSSVNALRRVMPAVREAGAEIRILLVHQGVRPFRDDEFNEVRAIARHFPEFDVIIGGHTHQPAPGFRIHGVWYTQAGYHGTKLGRVDIVYDTVRRAVTRVECQLMPVDATVPEDEELRAILKPELERVERFATQIVGHVARDLTPSTRAPGQCPVQQLLARAIQESTGAEIVFHGVLSEEGLPAGPVTVRDLWRLVPYENRVGLLSLTPRQIRAVLEENANWANTPYFQGIFGLRYDLDLSAPEGARVGNLRLPNGEKLHGRRRYRVAVNTYVLASGGGRHRRVRAWSRDPHVRLEITKANTREMLRDYIRRHRVVDVDRGDEILLKQQPASRKRKT